MELTGEDLLRLNVMMAQKPKAVRIDENRMQVFALTDDGEARVDLNPNGRHEQYVRKVREFLSGHVFGSPGGYPVFISRWTRMGQAKDENLQQLLMLGEPEAVVAVVHAKGLKPEVGHCAWWCMPESENARRMLEKEAIVNSDLGPVLADHLFEHLAFETEPKPMIESIRLMLQPGLIDDEKKEKLWRTSQRKNAYLVGFLQSSPETIQHQLTDHDYIDKAQAQLSTLTDNPQAAELLWLLSEEGRGYLNTAYTVFKKPANQDVIVYLLQTLEKRLSAFRPIPDNEPLNTVERINEIVTNLMQEDSPDFQRASATWQAVVSAVNDDEEASELLAGLAWLSFLSEGIVNSIFSQTTAEGTLMRKKLKPVTDSIFPKFDLLLA